MSEPGWMIREHADVDVDEVYGLYPTLFSICLHTGGRLTSPPNRTYVGGKITFVDLIDIDKFSVHELDLMLDTLGYNGTMPMYYQFLHPEKTLDEPLEHLSSDQDCLNLAKHVEKHKVIHVYTSHGIKNIKEIFMSPTKSKSITIKEIDEPGPYAIVPLNLTMQFNRQSSNVVKDRKSIDDVQVGQSSGNRQSIDVVKDGKSFDDVQVGQSSGYMEPNEAVKEGKHINDDVHVGHSRVSVDDVQSSGASYANEGIQNALNEVGGDSDDTGDSDYIVDTDNNMTDHEVDMSDYKMNVDSDVDDEFEMPGTADNMDLGEDVIDNDKFLSGSDSDDLEGSSRKHILHGIRRSNESMASFYLGQTFGTKEECKNLIRKHAVETRRLIKFKHDDLIRLRAVCTGSKPDFQVDDNGIHVDSQPTRKKKKGKEEGASGSRSKGKGAVLKKKGTTSEPNVGGRGKRTNPHQYQCPWVLLLSREKDSQSWVVKTLNTNHTCIQSRNIYACTSTFLSEQMLEQIQENPNIPVKAVQDQFRRKYGVGVHRMKAYRAKIKAKKRVEGDYMEQYSLLREYADELLDKNPGSTVKIEVEVPPDPEVTTRQFKRIYVCLAPLKQGFKALNRDLLGLDGAFMKGTFPGQMLTAVGLDSNNGIYPVCYAIVESESLSSWTWFLELLAEDLEIGTNSRFTFMSDRQKGLLPAIQNLFPCAEHRYCLRHIHENMKLAGYRGVLYKNMLYKCATSTTKPEFLSAMNELKEFNKEAHLWLSNIPPEHWSRSHYSGRAISDVMINNMCEAYNGKIVEGRDRPIISALEYVREYLMRRIVTVLGVIDNSEGLLTPRATQLFEKIKKQANHYNVQWNGGDLYEVSGKPTDPRVVNLAMRTCSCRGWEITGIPCRHAVAALWVMAANGGRVGALESWVHPVHTMDRWKLVYSFKVNPINGMSLWSKCEAPTTIVAPKHHTMAGRPKKARKRSVVEKDDVPKTGKLTRKSTSGACSRCGVTGHNVRTCTGPVKKKGKKTDLKAP